MNIIEILVGALSAPQFLDRFSGAIGESSATAHRGLGAAIPAIVGALISKGSTEAGAGAVIALMNDLKIDGVLFDQPGALFGAAAAGAQGSVGATILQNLLGSNADAVSKLIGATSGMSSDKASALMVLAAPAVLGGVARAAPASAFSAAELSGFLLGQKDHLAKVAPAGLGSLLGLGELGPVVPPVTNVAPPALGASGRSFMPWLIAAALLAVALVAGIARCSSPRVEQPVTEAPVAPEPVTPAAPEPVPAAEPAPVEVTLPSGTKLSVPPGSVGENLFNFLNGEEVGSKTFLFDGLMFDVGEASLDPSSQSTITAIADILKEFSSVTVSVDGYTDNQGSPGANVRLSLARARTVLEALTAAGVDAARIKAVGHGDGKPVADNATEEGRAQNRRTELTATKN